MPADHPACSLEPDALARRLEEWRALDAHTLRRRTAGGIVVTTYPDRPDVAAEVSRLVAAEGECCSFLSFEVREGEGTIEVELRFPPAFAATVASALGPRPQD